jgi:hypothetical protein
MKLTAPDASKKLRAVKARRSTTVKPDCIKVNGTLYRTVNVMIRNKEQVKNIKEAHNKDDSDSRNPIWYSVC